MNRTFTIIKPNAVAAGDTGKILDHIISGGFRIRALKMICMSRSDASKFYYVHRDKEFFCELVDFMTSGAVVVAIIEKEDAVASLRKLVGNTDPAEAEEGTIRKIYGISLRQNSIHASDSDEHARKEWQQFFREDEIIDADFCYVHSKY